MGNVVLVDGQNLAHRFYHVHKHLTNESGEPTGIMYGIIGATQRLAKKYEADVVFFWDTGVNINGKKVPFVPTWRKSLQTEKVYKGNRERDPEKDTALNIQLPRLSRMLSVLGYKQLCVPGVEADDLMGIAAYKLSKVEPSSKIYIYTGDRDLFQCITKNVSVLRPEDNKIVKYDLKRFCKYSKLNNPHEWALYKALVGDATDHYGGLPGCGPVKGLEMIVKDQMYPIYPWEALPKSKRKKWEKFKDVWHEAQRCYQLALIPASWKYKLLPDEVRPLVKKQILDLMTNGCGRRPMTADEKKDAIRQFTKFCAMHNMAEFLAVRKMFFTNVPVKD